MNIHDADKHDLTLPPAAAATEDPALALAVSAPERAHALAHASSSTHDTDTVLLTPEQLALKLGISRRCLSNWARSRIFPMIKIGKTCRFDLQKVRAALEKYEQAATR